MSKSYSSNNLQVLQGLEAVKKRPGMYIGSTDVNGLHHLMWEIVDNSIDEVLAGFAKNIKVTLKNDKTVIVEDDGRGIPVDLHKKTGKSGVELVFTELHAGGKFGQENSAYKVSGGLHGVGSSVVNALSDYLEVVVYRDSNEYVTIFENGNIIQNTKKVGTTSKRGTKVIFKPTYKIFKNSKFSFERIAERLREASFLISGLTVNIKEEGTGKKEEFISKNGMNDFIGFINDAKTPYTKSYSFSDTKYDIEINLGFQYTNDYSDAILSFVNNVKTKEGGSHVQGFKNTWKKILNDYARQNQLLKAKDNPLDEKDIIEGLTAIISIKVPENLLEFVGQTKDSLRTPEAYKAVSEVVSTKLGFWLQENKSEATKIISKSLNAAKAREAARKASQETRKIKNSLKEPKILSGKLTPAQTKKIEDRELFLVEGDSAGGSAKLGRDRKTQAILPLKGKVINTEKEKLSNVLKNEEIGTIINIIGAGIASEFKLKNAKYGKIIIMTDADTDGAHIQTLLLTFLFRYMRPLIESGKVFIAMPPLYKVTFNKNKKFEYLWTDEELKEVMENNKSNIEIQRYKGLGEMNAEQLWETTMNPNTRTLIQVDIDDVVIAERRVSTLMGDSAERRKEWINNNVDFSQDDNFGID